MRKKLDKPLSDDFLEIAGRSYDMEGAVISAIDQQRGARASNDVYPGVIKTEYGYRCTRKAVDREREYAVFNDFPGAMVWVLSV